MPLFPRAAFPPATLRILNPCGLFFSPSRCLTACMQTWACLHVCLEVTPGTTKMVCMAPLGHVSGGTQSHTRSHPPPPTERVWGPELHQPASLSTCRLQHPGTLTSVQGFTILSCPHVPKSIKLHLKQRSGHLGRHENAYYPQSIQEFSSPMCLNSPF